MSNWVKFYKREKTNRLFYLCSSNKFFKIGEEIITKVTQDCIRFTKPSLNYIGKTNIVTIQPLWKETHKLGFVSNVEIPLNQKLYIDEEESNEDRVVVYFNKNNNG
jgi:hypothetical protein